VAVEGRHGARSSAARGARFTAVMTAIVERLPFGLAGLISPRLAGFLVISAVTFAVDLALLTAVHGGLGWPLPAGITVAYTAASALGYLLNRALNFRSHGAVGPQVIWYAAVVIVNYLGCILGGPLPWPPWAPTTGWPGSPLPPARRCTCIPPCAGSSSVTQPAPPAGPTSQPMASAARICGCRADGRAVTSWAGHVLPLDREERAGNAGGGLIRPPAGIARLRRPRAWRGSGC
jgi:hypothetical protein